MTFCDELSLLTVQDEFDNNDDSRIRMILEDNCHPYRPDRSFAESGEVMFRPANRSEMLSERRLWLSKWSTVGRCRTALMCAKRWSSWCRTCQSIGETNTIRSDFNNEWRVTALMRILGFPHRVLGRFVADSSAEEAVSCEPVSWRAFPC